MKGPPKVRRLRITGARGDWTADVEGVRLPVIHTTWRDGPNKYRDPMVGEKLDGKRYQGYVELLLRSTEVVLQRDADPQSLARNGYVGVFSFVDLDVEAGGAISLNLTKRVADPR